MPKLSQGHALLGFDVFVDLVLLLFNGGWFFLSERCDFIFEVVITTVYY